MVVNHDRWFLDRIFTHILAFEGDSQARLFLGNWPDCEADYKEHYGTSIQEFPSLPFSYDGILTRQ